MDFTVDRNSTKWVLGAEGVLIQYAVDEPAIEFNADGSYKGVLVEPASTNEITYSQDFQNTTQAGETRPWVQNNISFTSNAAISPDGNQTADKIVATVTNGRHNIEQDSSESGDLSFSIFAKADGYNVLQITDARDGSAFANFDLSDGSIGSSSIYTASIRNYGNGWYRCSVSVSGSLTINKVRYSIVTSSSSVRVEEFAGDGTSGILIWGAQVETGPIATSYIPTTGSQVTRNKDDIYLTGASSLIGQTEGTMFIEVDWQLASGTFQQLLELNDVTNNNRIAIYNSASPIELRMFAKANTVDVTNQGESSTGYSGIQKIAFAYKTNDFELYRNGSSISTDTSGSLASLATLTDVNFGNRDIGGGAGNHANMWIRAVALYTSRLSDAECEALTTL